MTPRVVPPTDACAYCDRPAPLLRRLAPLLRRLAWRAAVWCARLGNWAENRSAGVCMVCSGTNRRRAR